MGANAQEKDAGWYFIQYMTNKASEAVIGTFTVVLVDYQLGKMILYKHTKS